MAAVIERTPVSPYREYLQQVLREAHCGLL